MPRLLIVDDRDRTIEICHKHLGEFEYVTRCNKTIPCQVCEEQHKGCPYKCAHDYLELDEVLARQERLPDLVVLDLHFAWPRARLLPVQSEEPSPPASESKAQLENLRRKQGLYIWERLRNSYPRLPIVMLTTTDTELGKERPADPLLYLCQNEIVDSRSLTHEIRRALSLSHESQEGSVFWGKNPQMAQVRRSLGVLSRSPLPTLIEGETGTGKSYLAEQFMHPRSCVKGDLVITDLSTIPASLLPAHLFGVRKGAYTGSTSDHAGVFEQAHQGTLFLDEIANLDLDLQRQLLLVLERNVITRLGDDKPRSCVVKLIAATNQDLAEWVRAGRFRADLYMRLNPATRVVLPPLRRRRDDIPQLLRHALLEALASKTLASLIHAFLVAHPTVENFNADDNVVIFRRPSAKAAKVNAFTVFIGPETLERIISFSWPGNHRQLRLFAMNALVFALSQELEDPATCATRARAPAVLSISDELVDSLIGMPTLESPQAPLMQSSKAVDKEVCHVEVPKGRGFAQISMQVERQYLEQLYFHHGGDLEELAKRLLGPKGTERQVHMRMNQLGLSVKSLRQKLLTQSTSRDGESAT